MTEFALALAAFLAAHSLPRATGLRDLAIKQVGRRTYVILYSVLSVGLLAWLISAALRAPYLELWAPGAATTHAALALMLPACLLFAMAAARRNPLSIAFAQGARPSAAPGVLALTRHPILWAFALWSTAHLIANGDLVAAILFGGMGIFSLAGMAIMDRRARRTMGEAAWAEAVARLRRAELSALFTRRCLVEAAIGALLYAALLHLHGPVIGVDPLALWR